jgi:hypothetical protein
MNISTDNALTDFEQCLSDLVAEERIEREHESQADKLAEELAEIARRFVDEAAKVARKSERDGVGNGRR